MNWTSQYPTRPGYYWIRNYRVMRRNDVPSPGPTIVELESDLDFHFIGDDDFYRRQHVLAAEWLGPISPPEEDK